MKRSHDIARARGFSLVIAMLMLAVIGLVSAAIMRNATSGDQVANNNRLQTQASQYAQLALRFCQNQLALAQATRSAVVFAAATPPAWTVERNWTTTGTSSAHALTSADIGSSVQPRIAPQCMLEATDVAGVYTITARGYSADYRRDLSTGATRTGSAVWLQATIYAEDGEPAGGDAGADAATSAFAGPLTVRQRTWQQLLTPPF